MSKNKEEYEVDLQPVILYIPKNTIKLTIDAKLLEEDEKMVDIRTIMTLPEIIEARIEGEYWEDEIVKYCLAEKE